jgi:hypothetical protein
MSFYYLFSGALVNLVIKRSLGEPWFRSNSKKLRALRDRSMCAALREVNASRSNGALAQEGSAHV